MRYPGGEAAAAAAARRGKELRAWNACWRNEGRARARAHGASLLFISVCHVARLVPHHGRSSATRPHFRRRVYYTRFSLSLSLSLLFLSAMHTCPRIVAAGIHASSTQNYTSWIALFGICILIHLTRSASLCHSTLAPRSSICLNFCHRTLSTAMR